MTVISNPSKAQFLQHRPYHYESVIWNDAFVDSVLDRIPKLAESSRCLPPVNVFQGCVSAQLGAAGLTYFCLLTAYWLDVLHRFAELENGLDGASTSINFESTRCSFCCYWLLGNLLDSRTVDTLKSIVSRKYGKISILS